MNQEQFQKIKLLKAEAASSGSGFTSSSSVSQTKPVPEAKKTEQEEKTTMSQNTPPPRSTTLGTQQADEDQETAIKVLTEKIEQMKPLYFISLATRNRKYELDMRDMGFSEETDWDLVCYGNVAAYHGQAKADATMFLDFCLIKRYGPREFGYQYNNVPAKVV
jgi:hypothetical protein